MEDIRKLLDEEIAEYVRKIDKESYVEIVLRYQDKLMRYVNSIIRDKDKSSDIVQNVFIKAFINLNNFNTKKKFSTWIYRIAHNETVNKIIKHKKEIPLADNFDITSDEDLETNFTKEEIKVEVNNCMLEMPILYKEPLSLYFLEEKSYEEISDILRLPIGTVGTRINRAKILLKKICQTKNQI